jgi:nicotinate-nucleotide adenylyltransferase
MMDKRKKVGLFFGSFNPVHVGHMIIANFMVVNGSVEEVWMVVSPHNPLKDKASLANDHDRLHLVNLAIGHNVKIKASNIEFSLPKPSYTIDTLTYLVEKHPSYDFNLIMGGDNLATIDKWKNYEKLLAEFKVLVYSRPNYDLSTKIKYANVTIVEAPLLDISASYIRECLRQKKSIQYLVPDEVFKYLENSSMYG